MGSPVGDCTRQSSNSESKVGLLGTFPSPVVLRIAERSQTKDLLTCPLHQHRGCRDGLPVARAKLSEQGVPAQVVQRFLDGLNRIDAKFPGGIAPNGQIQGFKTADKNASLANVLPRLWELAAARSV